METFITHHKGVGKLKIWKSASSAQQIHSSLCANRGILESDLDIYKVLDAQTVLNAPTLFTVSDTEIECLEQYISHEDNVIDVHYKALTPEELAEQSQQVQDDIAFNDAREAEMEAAKTAADLAAYTAAKDQLIDVAEIQVVRNFICQCTRPCQTISVEKVMI